MFRLNVTAPEHGVAPRRLGAGSAHPRSPHEPKPFREPPALAALARFVVDAGRQWLVGLDGLLRPRLDLARVAAELKKTTGRDMLVDGAIGFQLRPSPGQQSSGVRLSNSAGGPGPTRSRRATALDVASHPLLDGVEVWLETDARGHGNRVRQGRPKTPASVPAFKAAGEPLVIDLDQLDIADSSGSIFDDRRDRIEALAWAGLMRLNAGKEDRVEARLRFQGSAHRDQGQVWHPCGAGCRRRALPGRCGAHTGGPRVQCKGRRWRGCTERNRQSRAPRHGASDCRAAGPGRQRVPAAACLAAALAVLGPHRTNRRRHRTAGIQAGATRPVTTRPRAGRGGGQR